MEIKTATSTIELTLTLTKREAELLQMVMLRNITIPDMIASDENLDEKEWRALSNIMNDIGMAL